MCLDIKTHARCSDPCVHAVETHVPPSPLEMLSYNLNSPLSPPQPLDGLRPIYRYHPGTYRIVPHAARLPLNLVSLHHRVRRDMLVFMPSSHRRHPCVRSLSLVGRSRAEPPLSPKIVFSLQLLLLLLLCKYSRKDSHREEIGRPRGLSLSILAPDIDCPGECYSTFRRLRHLDHSKPLDAVKPHFVSLITDP